ncbi:hypothetical protein FSBG_00168 [Fusobacterium gonidiaformans 3-1-5R]|uniref:DUF7167 domain-containing protein n=1 Tax=Fusobacterium gonidiaformans 3-1-5R TaxID=469605 RepID=E5BEZ0_9FUSO|nr:hypothetical protein [Fusobacterium gonidiaformans]EFS20671.1 hypothetical protein FSBG_00168 [Fusobacterium gonidiaformans 3-1-5R]
MSKYKIKFHVSTGYVSSKIEETIDLLKDYGYSEEEAKEIIKNEDKIEAIFEEWVWETLDSGWEVLEVEE